MLNYRIHSIRQLLDASEYGRKGIIDAVHWFVAATLKLNNKTGWGRRVRKVVELKWNAK